MQAFQVRLQRHEHGLVHEVDRVRPQRELRRAGDVEAVQDAARREGRQGQQAEAQRGQRKAERGRDRRRRPIEADAGQYTGTQGETGGAQGVRVAQHTGKRLRMEVPQQGDGDAGQQFVGAAEGRIIDFGHERIVPMQRVRRRARGHARRDGPKQQAPRQPDGKADAGKRQHGEGQQQVELLFDAQRPGMREGLAVREAEVLREPEEAPRRRHA